MQSTFSGPYGGEKHHENSFGDPAFEPQQNFVFDEGASDNEFQNMQRSFSTFNALKDDSLHDSDFLNPDFFGQEDLTPDPSWHTGQLPTDFSPQAAILHERGDSVVQQFGQITPPDDSTPFAPPTPVGVPAKTSAKSERARNAANQRHAKAKKAGTDSARSVDSNDPDANVGDDKREKYREKNRLAAAKCRAKKKNNTEDLEESARIISSTNSRLKAEERELRDIFSSLRHQALSHDPTQGCTCSAIHMYNNHKAQEAARGAAMGFAAYRIPSIPAVPSPSLESIGTARSRIASEAPRSQSFSSGKAGCLKHPERENDSVDMLRGYMPLTTDAEMQSPSVEEMGGSSFGFPPLMGNPSLSPTGESQHLRE